MSTKIVVATRNKHKLEEIQSILGLPCLGLDDFPDAAGIIEDAGTFAGNAAKKAMELAAWLRTKGEQCLVLADDSGLEVDALGGVPGVHSARFAALDSEAPGNSPDSANNEKLLRLLKDVPREKRTGRFRCVLAVSEVAPHSALSAPHFFEGTCEGWIDFQPRGLKGFGYDPLFIPNGYEQSFAELGDQIKNRISHRSKALEKLSGWLEERR